jgi:hypothetical protein
MPDHCISSRDDKNLTSNLFGRMFDVLGVLNIIIAFVLI